jgi:uncharacterized repeat protein (TIGR01451 family)
VARAHVRRSCFIRSAWSRRFVVFAASVEATLLLSSGAFALGGSPTLTAPRATVTPSINGAIGQGEWDDATTLSVPFANHPATLYVKHDSAYLYVLLAVTDNPIGVDSARATAAAPAWFGEIAFDNTLNGSRDVNDDAMRWISGPTGDDVFFNGDTYDEDTSAGGKNDVTAAASFDYARVQEILEGKKPLCSGDPHDFCVTNGSSVGFTIEYQPFFTPLVAYPTNDSDAAHYAELRISPSALNPVADLSVAKSADKASVDVGEPTTYTIVVTNKGPDPATNVVLKDVQSTSGVSVQAGLLQPCQATPKTGGCSLGTLAAGEKAVIHQQVTPTSAPEGGTIHDKVTVSATEPDPTAADDTAESTVTVRKPTPLPGQKVVTQTVSGTILVRQPGGSFAPLKYGKPIPMGSEVDARRGTVLVTSQAPGGRRQTATVSQGRFVITQPQGRALTILHLAPPFSCATRRRAGPVRRLLVVANGKFRTVGARGWAMPAKRGAKWLTVDSCVPRRRRTFVRRSLAAATRRKLHKQSCITSYGRRSTYDYNPEHRPPRYRPKKRKVCVPPA